MLLNNHAMVEAELWNNIVAGAPAIQPRGPGRIEGNLTRDARRAWARNPRDVRFEPTTDSAAVDAAHLPEDAPHLVPAFEYVHPLGYRPRRKVWRPDVGAYERCGL